jgi:hypothetical protein
VDQASFETALTAICSQLTGEARAKKFNSSKEFENRVREVTQEILSHEQVVIDFDPHPQAFPDIAVNEFGIEVKFSESDTWRSVANSVLERNRIDSVKKIYVLFGKMGGLPEVSWGEYDKCVVHVRTSHVPRFEVELFSDRSLFDQIGISYDEFRQSEMDEKMKYIRAYARGRLKEGERLWWLEDNLDEGHTLPIQARLYTKLSAEEKIRYRAEAALLSPQVVKGGRASNKYDDVVLYLLTYHGILCHQARDLFSAGSVANPNNDDEGGIYIERSLKLLENEMLAAAQRMEDELFVEYWGRSVARDDRIAEWLRKADDLAAEWTPSKSLFLKYQEGRKNR